MIFEHTENVYFSKKIEEEIKNNKMIEKLSQEANGLPRFGHLSADNMFGIGYEAVKPEDIPNFLDESGLLKKRKARMGKNNSVKKIDEEQILKRFEYTVQEYIRFYDFYKNQEVSEENTEAFYVMLQTKLMILRKYDYNREDVYLSNVFDAIDKMYPEVGENINILREKFEKLNNYYMEVILSDGTSLNLYKAIEDVLYGLYLHADPDKIERLLKTNKNVYLMAVSERWHVVYLVPAIIGFVMSLFALLFARETNAFLTKRIEYLKTPIEEREQRSKEGREQNAQGGILTAVKFAFRHRQLRFLIIACCCFYLASLGTATYSTVMAKSALMTEEEITLALFLYPVGNALFTLISGFVSDKFGRKVTIVAMSCSALTCYLLFIFSGMFKWTPYLTGFAIGGFMGSYWGAGDTIGGIMFSESTPTNLRSSVTVINTLLNGVMGGLATVITMILLPIIPERMFGYMYLGLTVPGLVGAIVIMWLFVGETRGLDLKTVTGTEWDKPKKVKEEQQDGE